MEKYTAFVAGLSAEDALAAAKLSFDDANRLDDVREALQTLREAEPAARDAFLALPAKRVSMRKLREPFVTSGPGEKKTWCSLRGEILQLKYSVIWVTDGHRIAIA
jgi:hypothetical protein